MSTTPRWGTPYPALTDAADVPQWMHDLAISIDNHAKDDQGLLSARPPAGRKGFYYHATDEGLDGSLYRDNGSAFKRVTGTEPWTLLTLTGGVWGFSQNIHYSKDGDGFVHFRGTVAKNDDASYPSGTALVTLPAGYRPGAKQYFPVTLLPGGGSALISITTDGVISTFTNWPTAFATQIEFSQVCFHAEG